jgi:hypothetical protein
MGRNREKFYYLTLGIPKDSPILEKLRQDSAGQTIPLAALAVIRLEDYYTLLEKLSARESNEQLAALVMTRLDDCYALLKWIGSQATGENPSNGAAPAVDAIDHNTTEALAYWE